MSKLIAGHYYSLIGNYRRATSSLVKDLSSLEKKVFKCNVAYYTAYKIYVNFEGQRNFSNHIIDGKDTWSIALYTSGYFKEVFIIKQEELDV